MSYAIHYLLEEGGHELVAPGRLRFHTEPELCESLRAAGFRVELVFGDWNRRAAGPASPELIVIAVADSS